MLRTAYEFEILVHGSPAKEYIHKGSIYIEGKEGTSFSLRMRNNSSERCLFVPTIDGLSVLNGKEGSFKSRGYIVNAYSSTTIDGWRTSDDKVAEFFFSSPKRSYAKRIGKGGNLGVIGCAVFKEKYHEPYWTTTSTAGQSSLNIPMWGSTPNSGQILNAFQCSATPTSSNLNSSTMSANFASAGLGTGFGQDKYSPTVTVDFDRDSTPVATFNIFYNTRVALESMGVEFKKPLFIAKEPNAFPNEDGYCPRPRY